MGREPADKPKPRVRWRGDHSGAPSHSSHWPWKPACASRSSSPSGRSLAHRPQWPCSPGLGRAVQEVGQRELTAGLLERRDDPVVALLAQVADDRRREDNGQGTELPLRERVRQALDDVAALERRRPERSVSTAWSRRSSLAV